MSSKCTAAKAYDILGIYDFPDDFDALNGLHSYFYASNDMVVEALASQKYDLARDIVTAIETVDKDGSYDDCAFYVSRDGIRILRTAEELIDALGDENGKTASTLLAKNGINVYSEGFQEIGSLFGREGAGVGFAKQTDGERLTFRDSSGIIHLKGRGESTGTLKSYADRCNEYLRFGDEVDLAVCGAYSPYDALKVCDTPEIFLKTGFEQRPMLYTQKHLFQALTPKSDYNPHRHGFSIAQVKRFPELLASPVALANSPNRDDVVLAILLATDDYGAPLIAGIKPDGMGNYGECEVETNMVLSVYSRQNFIRYFALLRDMDAFVFVSGRKIEALEDLSGLPLAGNCSGLAMDRILQRPKCLG